MYAWKKCLINLVSATEKKIIISLLYLARRCNIRPSLATSEQIVIDIFIQSGLQLDLPCPGFIHPYAVQPQYEYVALSCIWKKNHKNITKTKKRKKKKICLYIIYIYNINLQNTVKYLTAYNEPKDDNIIRK